MPKDEKKQNQEPEQNPERENSPEDGNPHSEPDDGSQGGLPGFNHPRLKGKTPEQVEALVSLLEDTVREQGSELTKAHAQQHQPAEESEPQIEMPNDDDFFDKPVESVSRVVQNEFGRLKKDFETMLNPLVEDIRGRKASGILEQFIQAYPDAKNYLPDMQEIARGMGVQLSDMATIQAIYWMAKGRASSEGGVDVRQQEPRQQEQPRQEPVRRDAPPQHRPQNQPLSQGEESSKKLRSLTESEERMRRENGMSVEEFLMWMEMDPSSVVTPESLKEK